jgi:hypothetical protein
VPNDANSASLGAECNSRIMQNMHHPIMAILLQPCWDFAILPFSLFLVQVCMKKLNPVIYI